VQHRNIPKEQRDWEEFEHDASIPYDPDIANKNRDWGVIH